MSHVVELNAPASPSAWHQLSDRYALRDDPTWQRWFDHDAARELLPGPFHSPVDVPQLCQSTPLDIWPGFMLPDTLPLVSNDYGDWWCLRIGAAGEIIEVIQWSHGGGDWLPIGKSVAQAALWDYVQNWRPAAIDIQRAAHEYPSREPQHPPDSIPQQRLLQWLSDALPADLATLHELLKQLNAGQYQSALELMLAHSWSVEAVACELVEIALQGRSARLASNHLARQCGITWVPDYTSWLFDTAHIPDEARQLIRQLDDQVHFDQDWQAAEVLAEQVRQQRSDLSWPGDIAGWAALKRGDLPTAVERFYQRRHASAFTDQSVRLRSHWFAEHFGKFSVAQLARLQEHLPPQQRLDPYLQLLWNEPASRTRMMVREFWLRRAKDARQAEQFDASYHYYMQAGWDLGAERMSDYLEILEGLRSSALVAGWPARSAVAAAHCECLHTRLRI